MLSPTSPTFNKSVSTPTSSSSGGGAKKVNVEVIMKSNPFRVGNILAYFIYFFSVKVIFNFKKEENEKTTRMELIRSSYGENNGMLRFTYYVRPECEAKKFRGKISLSLIIIK
jgi:hypothetical protein